MLRAVRRIPLKNFRFLGNVTKSELIGGFEKFQKLNVEFELFEFKKFVFFLNLKP